MKNNPGCSSTNIEENELKDKSDNFNTPVNRLYKKRLCLKCGKKFLSEGPHNRICVKCGLINVRIIVGTYSVSLRFSDVMI
ncbi:hypothetical protein LCGC14_3072240 [marine sediment metagenome]|uniref:Uncharacterized protein n=1 Tax=marine sediment metagenome TaxID=412755 RepID=A0A0F8WGE0_9ZZZZ